MNDFIKRKQTTSLIFRFFYSYVFKERKAIGSYSQISRVQQQN